MEPPTPPAQPTQLKLRISRWKIITVIVFVIIGLLALSGLVFGTGLSFGWKTKVKCGRIEYCIGALYSAGKKCMGATVSIGSRDCAATIPTEEEQQCIVEHTPSVLQHVNSCYRECCITKSPSDRDACFGTCSSMDSPVKQNLNQNTNSAMWKDVACENRVAGRSLTPGEVACEADDQCIVVTGSSCPTCDDITFSCVERGGDKI